MNKPNQSNPPFDDDIAELFDAQELEVPAALDDHIRSMARAELGDNSAVVGSATSRYAPVFATAAVMVLAVALVPMLIDQSTSPETSSSSAIAPMAAAPESHEISSEASSSDLASTADRASTEAEMAPALEQSALKGGSAGALEDKDDSHTNAVKKLPKQSAPEVPNGGADATSTIRMPSAISTLRAPNTAAADNLLMDGVELAITSDSEDVHRVSQASWLQELNRLYEAEEKAVFLDELALFKQQYPAVDLKKHLPPDALKLELGD